MKKYYDSVKVELISFTEDVITSSAVVTEWDVFAE